MPFPHANDAKETKAFIGTLNRLATLVQIFAVTLIAVIAYWVFKTLEA